MNASVGMFRGPAVALLVLRAVFASALGAPITAAAIESAEVKLPMHERLETLHAASALRPQVHPLRVAEGCIEFDLVMPPRRSPR